MQLRASRLAALTVAAPLWLLPFDDARAASPCVAAADSAQDLRSASRLREAREKLLVCSQRTCNNVVRADCEKWLKEVDEQTPSVVIRTVDARGRDVLGARVSIDEISIKLDGSPVPVDPGKHVVKAHAKSGASVEQRVLVALGEKARVLEVRFTEPLEEDGSKAGPKEPPPTEAPSPPTSARDDGGGRALPFVLVGVGIVGLGAFTYFEVSGHAAYSDLEKGCLQRSGRCTDAEIDPVQQQFVFAGVSLAVSAVALAAATIVWLTQRKPAATSFHPGLLRF